MLRRKTGSSFQAKRSLQLLLLWRVWVALSVAAGIGFSLTEWPPINRIAMEIEQPPHSDRFQIYFLQDMNYSKDLHSDAMAKESNQPATLWFSIPRLSDAVRRIRIDPGSQPASLQINRISFYSYLYITRIHVADLELCALKDKIQLLHSILSIDLDNCRLKIQANGNDPYFDFPFTVDTVFRSGYTIIWFIKLFSILTIMLAGFLLWHPNKLLRHLTDFWIYLIRLFTTREEDRLVQIPDFFRTHWKWVAAGAFLLLVVNILRLWPHVHDPGLYTEDAPEYFSAIYRFHHSLAGFPERVEEYFATSMRVHGYLAVIPYLLGMVAGLFPVTFQPWAYLVLANTMANFAVLSFCWSGVIRKNEYLVIAPLFLGLVGVMHPFIYITLAYQIYTAVILLISLLLYPSPRSTGWLIAWMVLLILLVFSGPYSILAIPFAAGLLLFFGDRRDALVRIFVIVGALLYLITMQGGTARPDLIVNPIVLTDMYQALLCEVLWLGFLKSAQPVHMIVVVCLISYFLWLHRGDRVYVKLSILMLGLVLAGIGTFYLSLKYVLYGRPNAAHLMMPTYFWVAFLVLTAERTARRFSRRLPGRLLIPTVLATIMVWSHIEQPEKRRFDNEPESQAYLDAIETVEQLGLEERNVYVLMRGKGGLDTYFKPIIRVGSYREDAQQVGREIVEDVKVSRFVVPLSKR